MDLAGAKGQGILASWVLTIIRALEKQSGLLRDDILGAAQLDGERLQQGSNRYSQQEVTQLWVCARKLAHNPAFGLCVAQEVKPASFHVVGHLMACSVTLLRALERLARYCRLLSDATTARLVSRGELITLEFLYDLDKNPPVAQSYDTVLASILHLLREISGDRIDPHSVNLRYSDTALDPAFEAFFSCPIAYGAAQECLTFNRADLERPILAADEELANLLEAVAREQLELRMQDRLPLRVRDALVAQFTDGAPSKAKTAQMLHMSERTMLRRLKEQGETYSGVLNQLREELAFQYLRQGHLSLGEIAERLGFSDYWAFSRAFKRWTGKTPGRHAKGAE
ncbi:AraC family transcriptional regulator [Spongiibacter taiwanensis]|uniref:AraC family transcriptional regulator n=1 Tax=Spongiibacter taiwanensis TaxID=1748242 RepID=UPI002036208D|nr:AraC family transcriptional regulator [Spongiibacter taiwanensis]USA44769.1 AraC family transcriptional regulator [Spongiibacter taiwanensis]